MKFSHIFVYATVVFTRAFAVPVETTESDSIELPSEAILGYLDLGKEGDISLLPFSNGTSNGLLIVNSSIVEAASAESGTLEKREADAWKWIRLSKGQPMYKRDANADPEAWKWIRLSKGQPMYKRDANVDPEAWKWISLNKGQPMYKRDANADPEAWKWISLNKGQPMY